MRSLSFLAHIATKRPLERDCTQRMLFRSLRFGSSSPVRRIRSSLTGPGFGRGFLFFCNRFSNGASQGLGIGGQRKSRSDRLFDHWQFLLSYHFQK